MGEKNTRTKRKPYKKIAFALAAAMLLLPIKSYAQSACVKADEIRVMIFASVFNQTMTYVPQDTGLFCKNCLTATLVPVNTGPAGLAQLQAGSLQFSDSSFDNT